MVIVRRLLQLFALLALGWLVPWNIQFYRAAYFADPRFSVDVYGHVAAMVTSPIGNRLSIWLDGDPTTRWDLFLDGENGTHLTTNFRPEEPIRLAGYRAGEGRHLAVQMESKSYALDSEALSKKSNTIRAIGLLLNGWIVALLIRKIRTEWFRSARKRVTDFRSV